MLGSLRNVFKEGRVEGVAGLEGPGDVSLVPLAWKKRPSCLGTRQGCRDWNVGRGRITRNVGFGGGGSRELA
jgi:hypothetical protein